MAKNIVVCCDGTGNEFGEQKSNVIKLYETLIRNATQIAYYHPGVGTMGARNALSPLGKWWTRVIGLAFGYGISDNIADAYEFLMKNFEANDSVFVFGFSRGAYTARALCGMLHVVGLLTEGNEGLIPYAIRMIKQKEIDFQVAAEFKKTFSRECKPHFVGVWDTVSSVGWVYNAVHFPFTRATKNADFHIVRHAVSIDERRAFFRENLFGEPHDPQQDIKEVWFAGVHSDVGGSYPEPESQLSKIALRWMLCEAELAGLLVDASRMTAILGGKPPNVSPDPTTKYQHESFAAHGGLLKCGRKSFTFGQLKESGTKRFALTSVGIAGFLRVHQSMNPWSSDCRKPSQLIGRATYLGSEPSSKTAVRIDSPADPDCNSGLVTCSIPSRSCVWLIPDKQLRATGVPAFY